MDFSLLKMFYLVYGKEIYLGNQKLKELIEKNKEKAQLRLFLDGFMKCSFDDLKNEFRHISMFDSKKVIAIRNGFSNESFMNDFLTFFKKHDTDHILIFFEEGEVDKKIVAFFKKKGEAFKCDPLKGKDLTDFIKKELGRYGATIDAQALDLLIRSCNKDLWRLSTEIQKLATYDKKITTKEVDLLVESPIEAEIFKTIDAIASKNKKKALELIYKHIEKGDSPFYLFTMIVYQFRNLLLVKEYESAGYNAAVKALKPMHPFVIKKSLWVTPKFTKKQLELIYTKIYKMDLALKLGKIKPELALELLIADI